MQVKLTVYWVTDLFYFCNAEYLSIFVPDTVICDELVSAALSFLAEYYRACKLPFKVDYYGHNNSVFQCNDTSRLAKMIKRIAIGAEGLEFHSRAGQIGNGSPLLQRFFEAMFFLSQAT